MNPSASQTRIGFWEARIGNFERRVPLFPLGGDSRREGSNGREPACSIRREVLQRKIAYRRESEFRSAGARELGALVPLSNPAGDRHNFPGRRRIVKVRLRKFTYFDKMSRDRSAKSVVFNVPMTFARRTTPTPVLRFI
jgi:hypothetical protein